VRHHFISLAIKHARKRQMKSDQATAGINKTPVDVAN